MKHDAGADATNNVLVQSSSHALYGFLSAVSVHNQFSHHGIVMGQNGILIVHSAIYPHPQTTGRMITINLTGRRGELEGVFGIDPAFDRMPRDLDIRLLITQLQTCCRTNLLTNDIDPGDHFGNRMLYLNSRIHLHEVIIMIRIEQKFHGTDTGITD